jgi:hypothetical protein
MPLLGYFKAQGFSQAVDQVKDDLREAKVRATSEAAPGQVYGVSFTEGSGEYSLFRGTPADVVREGHLGTGAVVTTVTCTPSGSTSGDDCYFYARGTASPGTIELGQEGTSRTATLEILPLTGRVEGD